MSEEKKYVLTFPWSENQEMQQWLENKVARANQLLDRIYEKELCTNVNEEDHSFFLQIGGIFYQVTKAISGVAENHKNSDAIATFECLQIPSADNDYKFEVSEEYFKNYMKVLEDIVSE